MNLRLLVGIQIAMLCAAQPVLKIPAVKTSMDVDGQKVEISAWGTLSAGSSGAYALALTIDLGDLQKQLLPVLAAQVNQSDKCGERISVEQATLAPEAPAGILTAHVNYERYACGKAFGKEIVKKVVGGHGVIDVKLTPQVADNNISLDAEVRKMQADGSLGEMLRSGSAGDSIRQDISDSVESAVQKAADLKAALPAGMRDAVTVRGIQFADGGAGKLWLNISGEVKISPEELRREVGQ
jgi:hypothetical protein